MVAAKNSGNGGQARGTGPVTMCKMGVGCCQASLS